MAGGILRTGLTGGGSGRGGSNRAGAAPASSGAASQGELLLEEAVFPPLVLHPVLGMICHPLVLPGGAEAVGAACGAERCDAVSGMCRVLPAPASFCACVLMDPVPVWLVMV